MRTAQDIFNVARRELGDTIITLMRRLDAYYETGKKNLMTAPEEDIIIDFSARKIEVVPTIRFMIDNPDDLEDRYTCYDDSPVDYINLCDGEFYVGACGNEYNERDLSLNDLYGIAKALEKIYYNL